jgi:L-malate glycosyltransferase
MYKVAYFIDSQDPGGAETLVINLSKRIIDYGFEPEILHFGNRWLARKASELGLACTEAPAYRYYGSIKTLPLFAAAFATLLRKHRIDLVHSHLFGAIVGASMATVSARIPHIGTLHDTYTIEAKPSRFSLLQIASILGTRLVAVSEHMRSYLRSIRCLYRPEIQKIWNGVAVHEFTPSTKARIRKIFQLEQTDIVLISVARLIEIKRYDVLIKAFARLKNDIPARLVIVGDGPYRDRIQRLLTDYHVQDRVKLLGFRDDVQQLLSMSDCFVLASDSEGLSYSIMESMAAGIPAVVTDVGGNGELVIDGESGYLVPRNDERALAARFQELVRDRGLRDKLGNNARLRAAQHFSIQQTVGEYVALYNQLIRRDRT